MEKKITDSNFEQEVRNSEIPVMVDFYADWCGPCKMMAPVVAQLAQQYEGKFAVGKLNTDENPKITEEFKVMTIPTFIFFKEGKAVDSVSGVVSKKDLEARMEQVLA